MDTGTVQAQQQLPAYRSHKTVWALKIAKIEEIEHGCCCLSNLVAHPMCTAHNDDMTLEGAEITPAEESYSPFRVTRAYMTKHNPQVGGYWVQYADGYQSFSPAKAFEEGYTRI